MVFKFERTFFIFPNTDIYVTLRSPHYTAPRDVNFDPNCSLLFIIFIFLRLFHSFSPVALTVVCSALGAQGSEATHSSELVVVTGGPASGEGLQGSLSDDDELETDEEVSGRDNENFSLHGKTFFFLFKC